LRLLAHLLTALATLLARFGGLFGATLGTRFVRRIESGARGLRCLIGRCCRQLDDFRNGVRERRARGHEPHCHVEGLYGSTLVLCERSCTAE
jgi:hypothetical protein